VLIAAGCGGKSKSGGNAQSSGGAQTTTTLNEGKPKPGGKLVYGLEADTSSPWTPANMVCAVSCHMVARTVYDALALYDDKGDTLPNLAKAIDHNADFTQWTILARDGVTFHDGTSFDGASICFNLQAQHDSFLTGTALLDVSALAPTADGKGCVVTMKEAWTKFPTFLAGQIGYMASPKWLQAVKDGSAKADQPVGTGPFVFKSYQPGDGGSFVATKNPNYWRKDADGVQLPYLDEVELRVLQTIESRSAALKDHAIDAMHTSNGTSIADFRQNKSFKMIENDQYGETGYILLNVGTEPTSPLADVRVRRALAMATNNDQISTERNAGVEPPANGPFSPSQIGYLADTGYPKYNPSGATDLLNQYKADHGGAPVKITYGTTSDPFNLQTGQLITAGWQAVGFDTNIEQVEQGQFVVKALQGDFQAYGWRLHGGVDADAQRVWWDSETAKDKGGLSLNFSRIRDTEIDKQFTILRTSNDDSARKAAAEAINRRFGDQCYEIWNTWTVWGIVLDPKVHNVDGFVLPDGTKGGFGSGIGGTHQLMQIWVDH
jgi:peptide/nickel transport system substrate-binding protein